jgi:hypothetical protein
LQTISIKTLFILVCLLITITSDAAHFQSTKPVDSIALPSHQHISTADTIVKPIQDNSFLKEKVTYSATDSMVIDMTNQKAYLYNNAIVIYEDMKLQAGYIELDFGKNLIYSKGIKDSAGNTVQKPVSEQGGEKFNAGEITYNFKTKKGKIKDITTQQGEGYIHGRDIKRDSNNIFYVSHGKYTTCNLEHPHFYIQAKKIKVIPNDKIITGPAQLNILDIPTPLVLPFGYFPNKKGRASGILVPTYGESANWGFFLKNGGYYFGMNEHVDLALTGDIYANGGFATRVNSNYSNRYHYNGGINLGYSHIINGISGTLTSTKQNDFLISWTHKQDNKANPSINFSANVNAASGSYNKFNGNVTGAYLTNTLQSNISFSKRFLGTPFNFTANARHSQNTINKTVSISLPELTLTMNRIFPFKNSNRVGNQWYDKIGVGATAKASNKINAGDSTLFTSYTLHHMQNGMQFIAPISTSLNVLKYFTLSPSISTSSTIYYQTIEKHLDAEHKNIITDTVTGIKMANDYSLAASLSTRVYGNYFFRTKHLKQIRHVVTPTISASYRPDFSESKYGYYKSVQDSTGKTQQYSIFEKGIYGGPASGKSGLVSLGLNNSLEAKVKQQTDSGTTTKKVMLIDQLNATTSYNIAAKSFKWSNIGLSGRTKLFKILNVNSSATIDPYQVDPQGNRIDYLEWSKGSIGRLTQAGVALGTSLHSKTNSTKPKTSNFATPDEIDYINTHPNAYVDFNIPWNLNVSYNLSYLKPGLTTTVIQAATFSGDLSVTKKWKISLRSGYDFTSKKLSLTSIDVYRDLHCWEMSFNWVPFGFRQSFSLNINIKSATLKDLKLTRKRQWQDYQ